MILLFVSCFLQQTVYASENCPTEVGTDSKGNANPICGDVNGDGKISTSDVMLVVNNILGTPAETYRAEAADTNLDGNIGMSDVMFIVQKILSGKYPDEEDINKIVFWGHSAGNIIEPILENELKSAVVNHFSFEKCSVYGENMLQIAARQGSIPPYFYKVNCKKIDNKYKIADKSYPLMSTYDGSPLTFSIINGVNHCVINGVSGELIKEQNSFFFRPDSIDSIILDSITIIKTAAYFNFRNPYFTFFWCDQVKDRKNLSTLMDKYKKMVDFSGNEHYLIIGSINGNSRTLKSVESLLASEFREHYFNAREFLVNQASNNLSSFSESDKNLLKNGGIPTVWMEDDVHLNTIGSGLIAKGIVRFLVNNNFFY